MAKRALLSVSDKSGIVDFAKELLNLDFEIISTGGTKKLLEQEGIEVKAVSEVTNFPEILDGRVKTLHPNIFGGVLAMRNSKEHLEQLNEQNIDLIDLVVVNLYPFKETILKENVTFEDAIENIDIGGPSMLRAAAKNHQDVAVIVDPKDYLVIVDQLKKDNNIDINLKKKLAAKVFRHTASYDALISQYLTEQFEDKYPEQLTLTFNKVQNLRYGENPHQDASFYKQELLQKGLPQATKLHGKELSYNNIQDTNAAWEMVNEFNDKKAIVAVKHMNPCGIGIGNTLVEAYEKAYEADPVSIFGGIIAANSIIEEELAIKLSELFLEVIIALDYTEKALEILTKKKNIRLLRLNNEKTTEKLQKFVSVSGGLLIQDEDKHQLDLDSIKIVTEKKPSEKQMEQLLFAWKVVKHVKSNAIVLAKDNQTIGIGAGQMNRVGAAKIAIEQAGDKAKGAVMASDAFFPMPDTVEEAAKAGVSAIIQPGGSIKDEDSILEANKHGIAMIFTGVRHFKH